MIWFSYGLLAAAVIAAAAFGTWALGISTAASLAIDLAGVISIGSLARMNGQDPDRLITEGAFRYSRNPQNAGIAIAGIEEAHLERVFGEGFRRYRAETPRWLGPTRADRG